MLVIGDIDKWAGNCNETRDSPTRRNYTAEYFSERHQTLVVHLFAAELLFFSKSLIFSLLLDKNSDTTIETL